MNAQIVEIKSNQLLIKLERVSYLMFLKIITEFNIFSYNINWLTEHYCHSEFIASNESEKILGFLQQLESISNDGYFLTFGQLINAEIVISKFALDSLLKKLFASGCPEQKMLGQILSPKNKFDDSPAKHELVDLSKDDDSEHSKKCELALLDADSSFENKIIFYYLYSKNAQNLKKTLEQAELMTVEAKEKIFEKIFQIGAVAALPKIITEHRFCSIQIIDSFHNLRSFLLCPQMPILFQPPSIHYGFITPPRIIESGNQEIFLTTAEKVKKQFHQTSDERLLPFFFRQSAIISPNLLQLDILKHRQSDIIANFFHWLEENFPFLKNLK